MSGWWCWGNFMIQEPTAGQKRGYRVGAELRSNTRLSIAQVKVHQELGDDGKCPGVICGRSWTTCGKMGLGVRERKRGTSE